MHYLPHTPEFAARRATPPALQCPGPWDYGLEASSWLPVLYGVGHRCAGLLDGAAAAAARFALRRSFAHAHELNV